MGVLCCVRCNLKYVVVQLLNYLNAVCSLVVSAKSFYPSLVFYLAQSIRNLNESCNWRRVSFELLVWHFSEASNSGSRAGLANWKFFSVLWELTSLVKINWWPNTSIIRLFILGKWPTLKKLSLCRHLCRYSGQTLSNDLLDDFATIIFVHTRFCWGCSLGKSGSIQEKCWLACGSKTSGSA